MALTIVIEGLDGSGKTTQYELLKKRFDENGIRYMSIKFPRYDTPSGQNITRYLKGDFGREAKGVNAYAASAFYAVDRYASYKSEWQSFHENEKGVVLLDRYTTANAIHQGAKLTGEERTEYFKWLADFEYELMKLPRPDLVICLNVPPETAHALTGKRGERDIHEDNLGYIKSSYEAMLDASRFFGWKLINCVENGKMKSPEVIGSDVYAEAEVKLRQVK